MKQITFIICTLIFFILNASNVWALPNCVGTWNPTNWNNCFGSYTWDDGTKYIGEYKNGEKNGQGTVTWTSGDKYFGEWINDRRTGQGTYWYANGDIYIGRFKDGKIAGHGTLTYSNGNKYVGKYNNGKRHGQGTFTWADGEWSGDKYVGEWKNDDRTGQGIYYSNGKVVQEGTFEDNKFISTQTLPNCIGSYNTTNWNNCIGSYETASGDKYEGEFKDGTYYGQGTYTYGMNTEWAGYKYIGYHKNNKRNGQGTLFYANGDVYIGEFKNDELSGKGTFTYGLNTKWAGHKYTGEFKNNKRNGQGAYTYPNGEKYVGQHQDDKVMGQGTYTWANGDKYIGGFKNKKRHGQGTYTYSDGTKNYGTWENDKLNGYAITYNANGSINQEGIFKDDKFLSEKKNALPACPTSGYFHNCFGSDEWDSGEKYIGEYRDNKRNGLGTYTYASGNMYTGEYKDNKKNGEGTFIWIEGDKYVGEYKNDKRNGHGTYTYPNGDKYIGKHKDSLFHGQGTYTYANGKKDVGTWENDKLNGYAITYNANGSINQKGIFKDDKFLYAKDSSPNILNKDTQDDKVINASSGSGFAVSPDGYVITNNHVIEGCQEVIVHTKEKDIKTRIISFDPQNDLALLKGDFRPETVFALSNNRPELLQDIYVAGYPFGNAISSSIKVTKGIISSLTGIGNNFSNIQIDAALQSGNSGGPIIDDNGNVIAVAVSKLDAKYMLENYGSIPENTNFGIKSSVVKSILDSNDVARPDANQSVISKTRLGKMISSGTYYISCWMTQAQIELLKSKKVLFEELN